MVSISFQRVLDKIRANALLSKLERSSSPNIYPAGGLIVMFRALRSLVEFSLRTLIEIRQGRASLSELRKLKGSAEGTEILILANGPSVESVDDEKVKHLQEQKKLKVLVMNNFFAMNLATKIEVDYYLLSDPFHHPLNSHPKNFQLWGYLENQFSGLLVVPRSWTKSIPSNCKPIFFEDRALVGWTKNISPTRPRGYISLTSLKALAFAAHLGFDSIQILGFDGSMFQSLQVNSENQLIQNQRHADGGATHQAVLLSEDFPNGVEDYFFDLAHTAHTLRTLFQGLPLINLNPDAFYSSIDKGDPNGLTRLWTT